MQMNQVSQTSQSGVFSKLNNSTGGETPKMKAYRQPSGKTITTLKRLIKQFNEKALESYFYFSDQTPENVAISILITARKECKMESLNAELMNLLSITSEKQAKEISKC